MPELAARAAEARRRRGLHDAADVLEGVPRHGVRRARRLGERQHRGEADVGAFHDRAPLVASLLLEDRFQALVHLAPTAAVELVRQVLALETGVLEEQRVEL